MYFTLGNRNYQDEIERPPLILKEALYGVLYGNPNIVTPKDYAQEYLKNSKQTLFKGED